MRKTKVICTIGPNTSSKESLKSLIDAGMNVCRLNFSHGSHEDHKKTISRVKELRKGLKRPLALLLDTKGPEVRTRNVVELLLEEGKMYPLHGDVGLEGIAISPKEVIKDLSVGDEVLFDDGILRAIIREETESGFMIEVTSGGMLKSNKSVNFPGVKLSLPHLNEKDREDILFGIKEGVDAIAASFAMSAEHILSIKELLRQNKGSHILVFSKIESLEGIHHFEEILEVSDGIMVARGDLAVECSFSQVPPMQKMMIDKCNEKGKPVIVATQMLESMVTNFSPTRAEVSDVANSVFDGTSCTMLSSETAVGKYPDHVVKVMSEILREAEKAAHDRSFTHHYVKNVSAKIACSAVESANDLNATAIIAFSKSGKTARQICSLRPHAQVIVVTPDESTYHQAAFLFGAIAMREDGTFDQKDLNNVMNIMETKGWVNFGDLVVVTMGIPFGVSFTTNTIRIESVGNALVRGRKMDTGFSEAVEAATTFFFPRSKSKHASLKGKIVIMTEFFEECCSHLKEVKGVVLQNAHYDKASEKALEEFSTKHNIPYIVRADGAMSLLKEGQLIKLDPSLSIIFACDSNKV